MVGWHHRLNGHECEQTPRDTEGQGSLVCCSPGGCQEWDTTERLKNNKHSNGAPAGQGRVRITGCPHFKSPACGPFLSSASLGPSLSLPALRKGGTLGLGVAWATWLRGTGESLCRMRTRLTTHATSGLGLETRIWLPLQGTARAATGVCVRVSLWAQEWVSCCTLCGAGLSCQTFDAHLGLGTKQTQAEKVRTQAWGHAHLGCVTQGKSLYLSQCQFPYL